MQICPQCERPIKSIGAWHYCQKKDIDELFEGKSEELLLIFDKIILGVAEWDDLAVSATKNCIVFVRNKTFLVLKPMKAAMDVKFYSKEATNEFPVRKSTLWSNKYENQVRLTSSEDIPPVIFDMIRRSYEMS